MSVKWILGCLGVVAGISANTAFAWRGQSGGNWQQQAVYHETQPAVYHEVRQTAAEVVVHSAPQPKVETVKKPVAKYSDSGCSCGGGGTPDGPCSGGAVCNYSVDASTGTTTTEADTKNPDLNVVDPGPNDCEAVKPTLEKFYSAEFTSPGKVLVPRKTTQCVEKYSFRNKTYDVCGCKVHVCVPCAVDVEKTCSCTPTLIDVAVKARVRTKDPGKADIWVYNVKGLPSIAVLGLSMDATTANATFKTNFSYH